MFKPSTKNQRQNIIIKTSNKQQLLINQQKTSETLTNISLKNMQVKHYLQPCSQQSSLELLKYTISHNNIQWLQKQLDAVNNSSKQIINNQNTIKTYNECTENLQIISDDIQTTLQRIKDYRKILQLKIINNFMLSAKYKNKKNVRKANLMKYRQILMNIKQLHNRSKNDICMQYQITQIKNRLRMSGIILLPSLVQKALINMVQRTIFERKCIIEIKNYQNLSIIIDFFMNDEKTLLRFTQNIKNQNLLENNVEQILYSKFKMYIFIKRFLSYRPQNQKYDKQYQQYSKIDQICQKNISQYIQINIRWISNTQLSKIRSIAQYSPQLSKYLHQLANQYLLQMFIKIQQFHIVLKNRAKYIQDNLISSILEKNKKLSKNKGNGVTVPQSCVLFLYNPAWKGQHKFSNYFNQYDEQQQFPGLIGIQEIGQILQFLQERAPILQNFSSEFNIRITIHQVTQFILTETIKLLLNIIVKIQIGLVKLQSQTVQQRNYTFGRMFNLDLWKSLFGKITKENSQQLINVIIQLKQQLILQSINIKKQQNKEQITHLTLQKNTLQMRKKITKLRSQKSKRSKKSTANNISIAEFAILYHQLNGQIYLFLTNKLINIFKIKNQQRKESIFRQLNFKALSVDSFMKIWLHIITQPIVQHFLNQCHPVNILTNINFLRDQVLQSIEESHRVQNLVNSIQKQLMNIKQNSQHYKKQSKGKKNQSVANVNEDFEEIYLKIMCVNLKTRNYNKLLSICCQIGVNGEFQTMHQSLYKNVFKNLEF